jgi:hypothetical protein
VRAETRRQNAPPPSVPVTFSAASATPPHIVAPSPAALLRSGRRNLIRLRFESGGLNRFPVDFKAISCQYGAADRPPLVHDFDTLPAGVDVVLYPACPVENHLARLSFGHHVFRYTRRFTNFVVDIKDSYETYRNRFSSKSRWVYKTKAKKLSKACAGEITYRQCRSAEEMKEFYDLARKVELGSFQEKVLRNGIPDDPLFFKEMMELASNGNVRGYLLIVEEKPVAYLYCLATPQTLFHETSGYDPAFATYSPGVLLQQYALQEIFAERRFRLFDFSSGGGQHKEFFSTRRLDRADVYIFRKTLRNVAIASFVAGLGLTLTKFTGLLGHVGLDARLRRLVRSLRQ